MQQPISLVMVHCDSLYEFGPELIYEDVRFKNRLWTFLLLMSSSDNEFLQPLGPQTLHRSLSLRPPNPNFQFFSSAQEIPYLQQQQFLKFGGLIYGALIINYLYYFDGPLM